MRPSNRAIHPPKHRALIAGLFLLAVSSHLIANEVPKVVARKSISQSHRSELEEKLKAITGWRDLRFTADGALILGSNRPNVGSSSARELLKKGISGDQIILLEDASGRKDVAFCRVGQAVWEEFASPVYVLLIDFADFKSVTGDRQARAAFDVGWAVLHEIDHVVEDSTDPETADVSGQCETHINTMRRELSLPVRSDYYFSYLPIKSNSSLISRFVRLGFDDRDNVSGKTKRYWLLWDAELVGGLPSAVQTASLF